MYVLLTNPNIKPTQKICHDQSMLIFTITINSFMLEAIFIYQVELSYANNFTPSNNRILNKYLLFFT